MMTAMNAVQKKSSPSDKVQQAKRAYAKYLFLLLQLGEEQRQALDKEVKSLEQQKIEQVRQFIQTMTV